MQDQTLTFEQGPIRPPNEAGSLLIRVSRNCPWNRCLFCPVYKTEKFSTRSMEEIKEDIDKIAAGIEQLKNFSIEKGFGGEVTHKLLSMLYHQAPALLPVANWLYLNEKSVFLQDADSTVYKGDKLAEIIRYIVEKIPGVERVTTYSRAKSLARRTLEELKDIKEAGLSRVHIGLESGSDNVLDYMQKGVTAQEQIEGGAKAKEAGLIVSEYVMPGLGGKTWWQEHARETARVLNQINPDFIRIRTLAIHPASPLMEEWNQGKFDPLTDDEIIQELRLFMENLNGINSAIYSDHILNLLEELEGVLPDDKEDMLNIIDNYLALYPQEKELFRLGRRTGLFRSLDDLNKKHLRGKAEEIFNQLEARGITVDDFINDMRTRYL